VNKKQAAAALARGKAELRAIDPTRRFEWCYFRSNRRDLIGAYMLMHPQHPAVRATRRAVREYKTGR
jgi:hypothetical protein